MRFSSAAPFLALATPAFAAPANDLEQRNPVNQCQVVNVVITAFKKYSARATSFCSSYISVPAKTSTSLTTIAQTSPLVTATTTITSGGLAVTITPAITVTATVTLNPAAIPKRRRDELQERAQQGLPSAFKPFNAGQLSTACSCLSIPQITSTVKSTATISLPPQTTTITSVISASGTTTKTAPASIVAASTVTVCANPLPTFVLQIQNTKTSFNFKQLSGTYASRDTATSDLIGFYGEASQNNAVVLSLNAAGNVVLVQTGAVAYQEADKADGSPTLLRFGSPAPAPAACRIQNGVLSCYGRGPNDSLALCPSDTDPLYLTTGSLSNNCRGATFQTVPVCMPPAA